MGQFGEHFGQNFDVDITDVTLGAGWQSSQYHARIPFIVKPLEPKPQIIRAKPLELRASSLVQAKIAVVTVLQVSKIKSRIKIMKSQVSKCEVEMQIITTSEIAEIKAIDEISEVAEVAEACSLPRTAWYKLFEGE